MTSSVHSSQVPQHAGLRSVVHLQRISGQAFRESVQTVVRRDSAVDQIDDFVLRRGNKLLSCCCLFQHHNSLGNDVVKLCQRVFFSALRLLFALKKSRRNDRSRRDSFLHVVLVLVCLLHTCHRVVLCVLQVDCLLEQASRRCNRLAVCFRGCLHGGHADLQRVLRQRDIPATCRLSHGRCLEFQRPSMPCRIFGFNGTSSQPRPRRPAIPQAACTRHSQNGGLCGTFRR